MLCSNNVEMILTGFLEVNGKGFQVRVGNEGPRPQNNDYNKFILKTNEVPIV
jgi:hypothetical protein